MPQQKQNVIDTILCTGSTDHDINCYIYHVKLVFYIQIERKNNQHFVTFNILQPIVTVTGKFDPMTVQTNRKTGIFMI